jgi:cell division septation protein DedD
MKRYNFLKRPLEPLEPDKGSTGSLSPQARRLLIIGLAGVVIAGGLYVYTTYFGDVPLPLPISLSPGDKGAPPPPPPTPAKPPQVPQAPVKPPVPLKPPDTEKAEPGVASNVEAPREAVSGVTKPPEVPSAPPAPATAEKATPQPVPPPTVAGKPSPQLAKVTEPKEKGEARFTVQVASLVVEQNARSLQERLKRLGYSPVVQKGIARVTRHRVYTGDFSTREEAEQAARRLSVDGFASKAVQGENGRFRLEVGLPLRLDDAIDLARNLERKNHPAKIVSQPVATPVHQVWVGEYGDRAEALKTLEALKKQGFAPVIVKR